MTVITEAAQMEVALAVLDATLAVIKWRLKPYARRRLHIDVLGLCTGMRPVVMVDYGGKMPELQGRLSSLLAHAQMVYVTVGCHNSIEVALGVLASPNANILIPRPGYPTYDSQAEFCKIQARRYRLIPEKDWEIDLDSVKALVDENTVAIVVINPGNPCGNVYTHDHLQKVAETMRELRVLVVADEVYGRIAFGSNHFVPMGAFGSIASVLTVGSISKRWVVSGWRLGWLVANDPNGLFKKYGCIERFLLLSPDPVTFIQVYAEKYAEDQEAFFKDYAKLHAKLSSLGVKFDPPQVFVICG